MVLGSHRDKKIILEWKLKKIILDHNIKDIRINYLKIMKFINLNINIS